ncbi:MAG: NfeD family protein [Chitinophagales bacterium]|nr:nodulation protein NfeD [Bacteroidota bacterium]MCB9042491.1 nodulation protein NfeD [Chitinophagales bacterium]
MFWINVGAQNESYLPNLDNYKDKKVYVFELKEEIFPAAWRKCKNALTEAQEAGSDVFLIEMNTYGGLVNIADSIRTALLKTPMTSMVLIDNNAASAGALISLACDSIFMVKGAQIGAATVVDAEGSQLPDKYQSYMRATMRSTAEVQGRDPLIAEAMVDDRIKIAGIIDTGKVLTFTSEEAFKHNFCDGIFDNAQDFLETLQPNTSNVQYYESNFMDKIMAWLLHPAVSGILLMLILGGIYFELQTPGIGFPLLVSIIAMVLYFAPNYVEGLAENWEILLFFLGLVLLALEIFVIPGFGITGILGIAFMISSLGLSLVGNQGFNFEWVSSASLIRAFGTVIISMALAIIAMFGLGGSLLNSPAFKKLSLETSLPSSNTLINKENYQQIGKTARTITDLRPSGIILLDNERVDAVTSGAFIPKNTTVNIVDFRENHFVVENNDAFS